MAYLFDTDAVSEVRLRVRAANSGPEDFVFTDPAGEPLSQEWLHKRICKPTLERAGIGTRGQYNIRDTFISIALSAGEDPASRAVRVYPNATTGTGRARPVLDDES